MGSVRRQDLKELLDRFYSEYNFRDRLLHDPIEFPHRYKNPEDVEVSAFIASSFAYGRVGLFKPVVEKVLSILGSSPHASLLEFDVRKQRRLFTFKYRFNEAEDILCLLYIIHSLIAKHTSIEHALTRHYAPGDLNTGNGIAGLTGEILSINTSPVYGKNIHPPGLSQFFSSPLKGSACKRTNLFLRWMVRDRDIDFGIWKSIPKSKLIIPLDIHLARISRCLGLTKRRTSDWKTAVEITNALKRLDSEDPLKYDFALCHHGISGMCERHGIQGCPDCVFSRRGSGTTQR